MHEHAPGGIRTADNRLLLALSLAITTSVMIVQVIGALLSGSLALLADAAHMLTDAAALVIALVASALAARPADARRTFGHQRAEVFGALINGVVLIILAGGVGVAAIVRLVRAEHAPIVGGTMLTVAVIGLCANGLAMWLLSAAQRGNINVRGAYLEVMGDLFGSVAVIVAAVIVVTTGWQPADALASVLIAVLIIPRAISLLREAVSVLGQSAPREVEVGVVREHILSTPGVRAVHDVHVWQLTRGAPVFSAHVVVDDDAVGGAQAARILCVLQECLAEHFDVAHSTFQLEPAGHREHDRHV